MRTMITTFVAMIFIAALSATAFGDPPAVPKETHPFPGRQSDYHGYDRYDFSVDGCPALVVAPRQPLPGKPWIWEAEFFDAAPQVDLALLAKGYHMVYIRVGNTFGCPDAMKHWDVFYKELTTNHGLSRKPVLEGISRGGLYCFNWAANNPEKVACILADNAVMDFKSWPGGKGKGKGSPGDWNELLRDYHFRSEAEALAYKKNPIDNLEPLAKAKVPLFLLCADADDIVPYLENGAIVKERYEKLGGAVAVLIKHGLGHHPHGPADPTPVVEFILKHTSVADELAEGIDHHVRQALEPVLSPRQLPSVTEFEPLAVSGSWTETWPDARGGESTRTVKGRIWNAAIAATLAKHGAAFLPKRNEPYYLDDPIVLKSGQRLAADREAEIRLKPGVGTCMVRNEHIVDGHAGPLPVGLKPDSQIAIEGGIWTTLRFPRQANGNVEVRSAKRNAVPGCYGTILLSNVRNVSLKNLIVRHGTGFGIHLSNCREFLVEGVTFEEHGRDGVHLNGPANYGVVRDIRGQTADDFIALNAWDWRYSTPTFGPIDHVLVERIYGDVRAHRSPETQAVREGTAEIRVFPGVENFPNHTRLDCPVAECVFRDLHDIRAVKLYDQPDLEMAPGLDFSDPIGTIRNVYFSKLSLCRPCVFQIAADVDGLYLDDVQLDFAFGGDYKLVEIGPMSDTWKNKPDDPATWVEVFSPNRDVTVRNFRLTNVWAKTGDTMRPLPDPEARLVKVSDQKPNPNYPKTTPRGGTGKAHWIR